MEQGHLIWSGSLGGLPGEVKLALRCEGLLSVI